MKLLTTTLACIIVFLLINNFQLRRTINKYRSNIPREEMTDILMKVTGGDIAVFIPGDTTVWPYLIKDKN